MRVMQMVLVLVLVGVRVSAGGQTTEDVRTYHGTFTGEVKPVIYVTSVEESMPFYRDVLGFEFDGFANADGQPYYAEMLAGSLKFGLHEPMSPAQESRVGNLRIYFRLSDLEKHFQRVTAWGGEPDEIIERAWMDMFSVPDPDGNLITFAYTDPDRHTIDPW